MLRTFVAVTIPATAPLRHLLRQIGAAGSRLRPPAADKLHVTLKFLGDTPVEQVPEVAAAIRSCLADQAACDVELSGIGAFPDLRRPSVFWVGIQNAGRLAEMARLLETTLAPLGYPPEARSFHPHLTVLRVKFRPPPALFELVAAHATADFGTAHIGAVEYLQSELKPGGSQYTVLAQIPLR
jgi:RNA 2',3'-cyclic 3'-phosphodiesterase